MTPEKIRSAAEAIIFAGGTPVELSRIAHALEITEKEAEKQINILIEEYEKAEKGITIIKLDKSYQMVSKKEFAPFIRTVMDLRRNTPLSQAALEVLAVVAYNQPVTKAFVEQVRGVDCSGVIGSLCTKGLIEEKGRLELPGRPLLYGTTQNFLRCFGISSVEQLPALPQNDENNSENQAEDNSQAEDSRQMKLNNYDENHNDNNDDTIVTTVEKVIEEAAKE
ncbi:MAG: SMC-Scp complex subunit ScpB [Oscillospiraceae bacterium]|nr:SMC-Scp complex subunit ScpB [Oscillospiraceae bacterium]